MGRTQAKLSGFKGSISLNKSKNHRTVLNMRTTNTTGNRVKCPICEKEILHSYFNIHLDGCLAKSNTDSSSSSSSSSLSSSQSLESKIDGLSLHVRSGGIPGLYLVDSFISEEEEREIVYNLDNEALKWKYSSFNGNTMSKSYGFKTSFGLPKEQRCVRRNDPSKGEPNMPSWLNFVISRLATIVSRHPFELNALNGLVKEINECNANSYESEDHFLRPHFDDRHLSGPFLINLSFLCPSIMTYCDSKSDKICDVFLPRRTLQIVTGDSRYYWTHEIKKGNVQGERRVSITWRCAGLTAGVVGLGSKIMNKFLGKNNEKEKDIESHKKDSVIRIKLD